MQDARREEFEEFKGFKEFELSGEPLQRNSLPATRELTESRS
jgi:hypothetical protein